MPITPESHPDFADTIVGVMDKLDVSDGRYAAVYEDGSVVAQGHEDDSVSEAVEQWAARRFPDETFEEVEERIAYVDLGGPERDREIAAEAQVKALDPRLAQVRLDDALSLASQVEAHAEIVMLTMNRLSEADLIVSLPGGTVAQGPGVLITSARLREELNEMYLAGIAEGTRRIAEG